MKANQKYLVTIDEPCHKRWSGMQPNEIGKFCGSCSKTVIDFTKLSDNEIISILEKTQSKELCGRFEANQLNKIMVQTNAPKTNPRLFKLLTAMLLVASMKPAVAQVSPLTNQTEINQQGESFVLGKMLIRPLIKGSVTDQNGNALKDVSILFLKTNAVFKTDVNGNFELRLNVGDEVKISKEGYFEKTLKVNSDVIKVVLQTKTIELNKPEKPLIRMGGLRSFNVTKKPIYVVDGIVIEEAKFRKIDSNSIESISILKDLDSSVGGCRRNINGIVVIKTKNAKNLTKK